MPLWDLVVKRTLGNIVQATAALIYHALVAATKSPARDTGVGHRSSGHPDNIDEQRASSPVGWRSAFKEPRVVGEIIAGELWITKFYHQIRYVVTTKDRERGIRIVLKKAVLSLTPQRNEPASLHMSGHACGTIGEADSNRVNSAQNKLSLVEAHILRVLHEEDIHFV